MNERNGRVRNLKKRNRKKPLAALTLSLAFLFTLFSAIAFAVPAYPGTQSVLDGTGNSLQIRNYGDEFFSYTATLDGDLVWRDDDNCFYYITTDGVSYSLGSRVFEDEPWYWRITPRFLRPKETRQRVNLNAVGDDFEQKLQTFYAKPQSTVSLFGRRSASSALEGYQPVEGEDPLFGKWVGPLDGFSAPEIPKRGNVCPLLILKIQYADVDCVFTDAQWSERIFGSEGVTGYYEEVSGGQFTYVPARESCGVENDGVITVTLPISHPPFSWSGMEHNYDKGAKADVYTSADGKHRYAVYGNASLFMYGLEAASSYIDYALYDQLSDGYHNGNGDGYVSPTELAILVVNAGYEASFGLSGVGDPATWASSWIANNWWKPSATDGEIVGTEGGVFLDGVKLYKFLIVGENLCGPPENTYYRKYDYALSLQQNLDAGNVPYQIEIGTVCHELGHDLGLQDLYDTSGTFQERAVSSLSLMASGSWGSAPENMDRPGSSPSHLDAFSKIYLGFYKAETISASGVYPVTEASDPAHYNILRVNTDNPDVYYLVENRLFRGFDRGLYSSSETSGGVVYWRIDEQVVREHYKENKVNNTPGAYGIMPEYVFYGFTDWDFYPLWKPFRNRETYDAFPEKRVFTLPEKPSVSLLCYDVTVPKMDVWLNASSPILLALRPDSAFPWGQATDLTAVLGEGSNVKLEELTGVELDGVPLLAPDEHEAREGSIEVTLKKAYLNTLAPGVHTLRLTLANGMSAEARVCVTLPGGESGADGGESDALSDSAQALLAAQAAELPQTGDASAPGLWAALLLLSAGILVLLRLNKRNSYTHTDV